MNQVLQERLKQLQEAAQVEWDVVIIGGGITGAGIAQDAALRGYKTLLVEAADFASGTSSKSTKLIHGGLRYLKQMEFGLVAEVGRERAIIHHNAPYLTKPLPMLLPIIKGGSLGKFSSRIGMWVYEWLAGVKKEEWHKVLSKTDCETTEPLLKKEVLLSGIMFYEYKTDDARLTMEVIKSAVHFSATVFNYLSCTGFLLEGERLIGIKTKDHFTETSTTFRAKCIINAAGPWVDEIDDMDKHPMPHVLQLTKGIHLVFDGQRIPIRQSVYFDTPDGRMMFMIPWRGKTYCGTTDTFYEGDLRHPGISKEDRDYILHAIHFLFPSLKLTPMDIESGWSGLRPLVQKKGKGPSEISRKDELFVSPSGLITIAGGKLTGYRKMAERVLKQVEKRLGQSKPCKTHLCPLPGALSNESDFTGFLHEQMAKGMALGLTAREAETLVYHFGSNVHRIFEYIQLQEGRQFGLPAYIGAQLRYCIEQEYCFYPEDFIIRRTGMLYFEMEGIKNYAKQVIEAMAYYLQWDDKQKNQAMARLQTICREIEELKV